MASRVPPRSRLDGVSVAAVQFKAQRGRPQENRARLSHRIAEAAEAGAEVVVLPEMCTSGYLFPDRESILPWCETRDGPTAQLFGGLAREFAITLAYGWPERDPVSGRCFNAATVFRPDGQTLYYRKRLLFEADTTWAEAGDTPYPIWTDPRGMVMTLGICMDLNDPRFTQHLRQSEARLCLFPTNWLDQGFAIWDYWAYRLAGSRACLVAANTFGVEDETAFRGESAVLDGLVLLAWAPTEGERILKVTVPFEPTPYPEAP